MGGIILLLSKNNTKNAINMIWFNRLQKQTIDKLLELLLILD